MLKQMKVLEKNYRLASYAIILNNHVFLSHICDCGVSDQGVTARVESGDGG